THQVGTDPKKPHSDEARKHGKWNDRGGDNRSSNVPKENQQNSGYKNESFKEILFYGSNRTVDHLRLIVEREYLHSIWQAHVRDLVFDCFDDALAIAPFEHDDGSRDGVLEMTDCGSLSWRRSDCDFRDIA